MSSERRTLVDGLKNTPPTVDPVKEAEFVYGDKAKPRPAERPADPQNVAALLNRVPISTRMKAEYANALKRASLERQLEGIEPNTLQDILEQAVEPWLRSNGYIR
ncbi:MAG TPA: hypothetical protein VGG19_16890 [Tepidisphaeraceae bacterium]|jgi:hypothetical protein